MTFRLSASKWGAGLLIALFLSVAANADDVTYKVVKKFDAEQYSLWPAYREVPPGWQEIGVTGTKEECLDYIQQQQ